MQLLGLAVDTARKPPPPYDTRMRTRMPAGLTGPRSLGILTGAAVMAVLVASCGGSSGNGPGVASLGTTTTVKATSSSAQGDPLKYSQCMRAHGVPDFPDPGAGGKLQISIHPGSDLDPQSAVFQAAQRACASLRPRPSAAQQQQAAAQALQFAQCMRAHGITNFPDPSTSGGGISIQIKGGTNLDPNSPLFQSAQNACQKYLPGKAQGGTSLNTTGGGKGSGSGGAVSVGG